MPLEEIRLGPRELEGLEEMVASQGWQTYQLLLGELLGDLKHSALKSNDWEHFCAARACAEMISERVMRLVIDALSTEKEDSHGS
jgi:hypothetical protein